MLLDDAAEAIVLSGSVAISVGSGEKVFEVVVEVSIEHGLIEGTEIFDPGSAVCDIKDQGVQVYKSELVITAVGLADKNVFDIQIRDADIQVVDFSDELSQRNDKFFFVLSAELRPVLADEFGQARLLEFFGDNKRKPFYFPFDFLAVTEGLIGSDVVFQKQMSVVPFGLGLGAEMSEVMPAKKHFFEVRAKKPFDEKFSGLILIK